MTKNNDSFDTASLRLAEQIVAILDEGHFTATYKYAVLVGLMDLCMEHCQKSGAAPTMLTTRQLAERIVELYWPHSQVFDRMVDPRVLWQNAAPKGSQATIITKIINFREKHAPDPSATLHRSRLSAPAHFEKMVQKIEWTLIRYPLPRLQFMGKTETRFLYQIDWTRLDTLKNESVLKKKVKNYQRGSESSFDNRINLIAGVGDLLIRLSGLLRPLIYNQWASKVAQINHLDRIQLERFLFENPRVNTRVLCEGLHHIQKGTCLYCDKKIINTQGAHVDHFIPRARYASDDLGNLILVHSQCNLDKKDFLAATPHLEKWLTRFHTPLDLKQVADAVKWELDVNKVLAMATAIYSRIPNDMPLWLNGKNFVPAVREDIRSVLSV